MEQYEFTLFHGEKQRDREKMKIFATVNRLSFKLQILPQNLVISIERICIEIPEIRFFAAVFCIPKSVKIEKDFNGKKNQNQREVFGRS